ncbi:MAG: PilC/PilY family type IV pilus protein [Marinobacter sp.]|uniref:pilus assembly protein n=1 Tax=Marinobacter sp. TaxID=50741 RepID=UPI003297C60F
MKNKIVRNVVPRSLSVAVASCLFSLITVNSALAAPVEIADVPPFLGGSVAPNIMFIIDDSGSMQFEMPETNDDRATEYLFPPVSNMYGDGIYTRNIFTFSENNRYSRYFRSSDNNPFFYDPTQTYEPWFKGDRSQWPDATPNAAYYFPGRTASGTLNLISERTYDDWVEDDGDYEYNDNRNYWPITYYKLRSPTADPWDKDSYFEYEIRGSTGYVKDLGSGNRVSVTEFVHDGVTRTVAEEAQNFANWFSYHRSRTLSARAGIGAAFSEQSEGMRVGYGRLNKGSGDVDGVNTSVIVNGVRLFKDTDRENFFTRLYTDEVPNAGTPLRNALYRAGKYYERSDNAGPWAAEPGGNNNADHLECRQSFTILMTDGYRSGSLSTDLGNVDGSDGDSIGDYQYEPASPFEDDYSNTLADVAMHFWARDLREDLPNDVPVSQKQGNIDPAFWQHMVTFGVGLGVTGSIDPTSAFNAISTGDNIDWPNPNNDTAKVDDLLHAAVNGRGGFFNAADPETFATQLASVLFDIVSRVEESSTSAAASSAVLREDALSFSAGFRSTDWSGALQAAEILPGGGRGRLIWDAEYGLESKGAAGRNIFTSSAGSGTSLNTLGSLSSVQRDALNTGLDGTVDGLGQDRIDWLRGDNAANAGFRDRMYAPSDGGMDRLRLLGDIIGSDPQFAGKTNFGHRRLPGVEGSSYATYRASSDYQDRADVIYVGANDGYLHGFDSLTGEELLAYMPSELLEPAEGSDFAQINSLIDPDYGHRYFVDGTPTIGDVYINGQWKTILVGTMGAGGKTVYALDVSDPENFGASDVLWEFTDSELGYGVEAPQIARLPSGEWAAIFGNGYNSDSNESAIFIVDIADGSLIARVETGEGDSATPNGMATPVVLIDQSSGIAKATYAGDLLGNLWRVDLTAGNMSSNGARDKLFTAESTDGTRQPITAAPSLALDPNGGPGELVVVFGTGSYFRVTDSGDNQVQSLYGIFDDGSASNVGRDDLLEQEITTQTQTNYQVDRDGVVSTESVDVRVISDNTLGATDEGWYVDLDTSSGERVISRASFPSGFPVKRVRFSTLIPDNNDCGGGRDGYLMDIDLSTGGQTDDAVFDLNRDGKFGTADASGSEVVNGIKGVVSGEEIRVVLDNRTDLFVDSVIEELSDDYEGPVDPTPDPDDPDGDDGDGDGGEPPCEGPACGDAEGYNFGRQNWEELR